jgi:addiction module RelE/StbE family toxin
MTPIVWDKPAVRAFRRVLKRNPALSKSVQETLQQLVEDPFHPSLETHKLKGKLTGYWACSAGYDLRIVFDFVKNETNEKEILLVDIGTHDEVY